MAGGPARRDSMEAVLVHGTACVFRRQAAVEQRIWLRVVLRASTQRIRRAYISLTRYPLSHRVGVWIGRIHQGRCEIRRKEASAGEIHAGGGSWRSSPGSADPATSSDSATPGAMTGGLGSGGAGLAWPQRAAVGRLGSIGLDGGP